MAKQKAKKKKARRLLASRLIARVSPKKPRRRAKEEEL
jgi:hypothetical protein